MWSTARSSGSTGFVLLPKGRECMLPPMDVRRPMDSSTRPIVLVVDDDALIRRVLCGVLQGHDFATAEATTVAGAIAFTEQQAVAAVVLDLTLDQGESGLEYLAWLREHPGHGRTPVLILTGRPTLEAGDQDLIQRYRAYVFYKPVSTTVLVEFLARLTTGQPS